MRRFFDWLAGAVGGIAAYRLVTRRREAPAPEPSGSPPPAPAHEVDPRAEALRAKLDEVREPEVAEPEPGELEAVEPEAAVAEPEAVEVVEAAAVQPEAGEPEPEPGVDPDDRRRTVHEHGRAALEEMRGAGDGPDAA